MVQSAAYITLLIQKRKAPQKTELFSSIVIEA